MWGSERALIMNPTRLWPAAFAAVAGSVMVGFMPILARHLYADGIAPPSMLLWRYTIALPALLIAAAAMRVDLLAAWRAGAWKIALVGATLGVGQTITFWESIKTLDTSVAALLFYILTVSAVFVLRRKRPDVPRPYRAWGYPVVPALYIIFCTVIMLSLLVVKPVFSWPSFIIVFAGIPVYFLWRSVNRVPV